MKSFKTLIAPIVIAAIAVTGFSAAQARADNNDLAKFIIGAVAVAALADALDKDHKKATVTSTAHSRYSGTSGYAGRVVDDRRYRDGRHREAYVSRTLSPSCLMTYRARHGSRDLYEGRCLRHANHNLASLPRHCEVRVVLRGGRNRTAYEPRCLVRAGFREARGDRHHHRADRSDRRLEELRRDERARVEERRTYDRRTGHIVYGN